MRKVLIYLVLTFASLSICSAQDKNLREKGYKGNVALTNQYLISIGLESVHGCMLDNHNFIGGGAELYFLPVGDMPIYTSLFAEYQNYILNKKSTPVAGIKAGITHAFQFEKKTGIMFKNGILLEPGFDWSWTLKNGNGLKTGIAATMICPFGTKRTDYNILILPKLKIAFEF